MKVKSILLTGLFASVAAFSMGAQAASEMGMDKTTEAKALAENVKTANAAPMKRHSHVEEKTGVPQSMPKASTTKPNAAKDMSKHYHPRDGK